MGSREIKSQFLSNEKIRDAAEEFRRTHIHNEDIPVNIELIVAAALDIDIIPLEGLHKDLEMDGLISIDLRYIYVDEDLYNDERYDNRIRFTIAHEIGQYVLHYDEIMDMDINNIDEWIEFRLDMDEDELDWFERQAHEFAGRLLVPVDPLVERFIKVRDEIMKNMSWSDKLDSEELINIAAGKLCKSFGVSADVIERRLLKDNAVKERLNL